MGSIAKVSSAAFLALSLVSMGCGSSGGGGGSSSASTSAPTTSASTTPTTTVGGSTTSGSTARTSPVTPLALPSGAVGGPRAKGIDVSRWQGTIDWAKVKADGIDFAIVRVSDGLNTPDVQFVRNWAEVKAKGLVRGVYQYFRAGQDPVRQADYLVDQVNAHGGFGAGDIPPTLDLEDYDGQSAATVKTNMDRWIARIVQRTGLHPSIYTSPSFWGGLAPASHGDDNTLWIAHWGVSSPRVPSGWVDWTFWQTSSTGSINGISGNVDTNLFNGTVADLRAYAQKTSAGFMRGIAPNSTGNGFWTISKDGGVQAYGDATFRGTWSAQHAQPVIGITRSASGLGYWAYTADGKVKAYGDATDQGGLTAAPSAPVTAMAATPSKRGYWLFGRDGEVHAFGDAQDYGKPAALSNEVVAAAATPTGHGYWLVTADGEVLDFGDAVNVGGLTQQLSSPVTAIAAMPNGRGYWLVQADGTLTHFGEAGALNVGGATLAGPVVAAAPSLTGKGVWLLTSDGTIVALGDAKDCGQRAR
ncbi:MAG: glycoside hydrolase family 25 protein [Planctomycetota bacterium]